MSSVHYDWSPLSLNEVALLFNKLPISWWIAGGVALELKDALDFAAVLPFLNDIENNWLLASLKIIYPDGHPWIDVLSDPDGRSNGLTGSGHATPLDP